MHSILFEPKGTIDTGDAGGEMMVQLQELSSGAIQRVDRGRLVEPIRPKTQIR